MQTLRRFNELGLREERNKVYGVVVAVVTNNVDEKGGYRVKVRFPWLSNGGSDNAEDSDWCRIATFLAGPDRGAHFLPEVNDEVLVAFEHGDVSRPVIVGMLWNGVDKATYSNKNDSGKVTWASFEGKHEAKKNDIRSITSRKFHQLVFNDNADEPRVSLHSSQKHRIVLNDKGNEATQIEIYDGKEENYVLIDTKNKKITIETKTGDMLLKAKGTIKLDAETIETNSSKGTKMTVGQNFEMQASSNMTIKASGTGDIESSGAMTIKGQKVNIN